jgi:HSP20 family protein
MLSFPEVNELSEDVRKVFEELDRLHGQVLRAPGHVHTPPLDVVETAEGVEVVVDLPGVPIEAVRVLFKHGTLVIAGEKVPREGCPPEHTAFHLVERGFGRFARVIRLSMAVDAARSRASLAAGELHVSIPRVPERRGREIVIPIDDGGDPVQPREPPASRS